MTHVCPSLLSPAAARAWLEPHDFYTGSRCCIKKSNDAAACRRTLRTFSLVAGRQQVCVRERERERESAGQRMAGRERTAGELLTRDEDDARDLTAHSSIQLLDLLTDFLAFFPCYQPASKGL